MDDLAVILAVTGVPLLVAGGLFYFTLYRMRQQGLRAAQRARETAERQQRAVWASATIISVRHSARLHAAEGASRVVLRLKVTPPGGEAYQALTTWVVDLAVLPHLRPGQPVSVRIDQEDTRRVYPNLSGARYLEPG